MIRRTIKLAALAAAATLALAACSSSSSSTTTPASTAPQSTSAAADGFTAPADGDKGGKDDPVKIGVVGASGPQWKIFKELAEKSGIYVDIQDFTDYQQPNPATTSGELDLNQFQHILFLADYNNNSGGDLVPIGATAIYPLALYSQQYTPLDEIPQGGTVAVPNDGTNQARALGVLASAGLITLKDGTPSLSATPADIDTASSKVTVTPVAADQTARSLDDKSVAAAVVNNDYVTDAGLDPQKALAQDDPSSDSARPFINVWVSTAANKDNPVFLKLVEISHDPTVEAALQENSGNTAVIVHDSAEQLQTYLADTQAQVKG